MNAKTGLEQLFSMEKRPSGSIEPFVISSTGSVASGKSTFLHSLHHALGYDTRGIPIDKEKIREMPKADRERKIHKRRNIGIARTSATYKPDSFAVYGLDNGQLYPFELYAPGGHPNAVKTEANPVIDGLLYFIDLKLAAFVNDLNTEKIYKFGEEYRRLYVPAGKSLFDALRLNVEFDVDTNWGRFGLVKQYAGVKHDDIDSIQTIDDLTNFLLKSVVDVPHFGLPKKEYWSKALLGYVRYKKEILGLVVQSIIDSHTYAESVLKDSIPVVGIGTHKAQVYGKLPEKHYELLQAVQNNFNHVIASFNEYQKLHGLTPPSTELNIKDLPIQWYLIEQLTKNRQPFIEVAYDIMTRALKSRGIDAADFKILTFSKAKSDLTLHYDMIK